MKGFDDTIKVVLLIVVGLIVIVSIMGVWGTVEGEASEGVDESAEDVQDQNQEASNVAECRFKHPGGGADYQSCLND